MKLHWRDIGVSGLYDIEQFCKKYNSNVDELQKIVLDILLSSKEIWKETYDEEFEHKEGRIRSEAYDEGRQDRVDLEEEEIEELIEKGKQIGIVSILGVGLENIVHKSFVKEIIEAAFDKGYERGYYVGTNWEEPEVNVRKPDTIIINETYKNDIGLANILTKLNNETLELKNERNE